MDGVPVSEVKDELKANALRREALQAKLATALQQPESRVEATEALRGLVDGIVLIPAANGKELGI
jgi:hypothetical protein